MSSADGEEKGKVGPELKGLNKVGSGDEEMRREDVWLKFLRKRDPLNGRNLILVSLHIFLLESNLRLNRLLICVACGSVRKGY